MLFSSVTYGLLAASLASHALAAPAQPINQRDMVIEDVVITEAVSVIEQADGSYVTKAAVAVGTSVEKTTVEAPTSAAPTSTTPTSTPVPTTSSTPSVASTPSPAPSSPAAKAVVGSPAVMQQSLSSSTSTTASPAPVPTTSSAAPAPTSESAPAPVISLPTTFATSTSTSSSAAASPTSPSTSSSGKIGLAYNDASYLEAFTSSLSTWAYNWGSSPGGDVPSSFEYVPMLWSNTETFTGGWDAAVSTAQASGSKHLLAFNEPDLSTQSNLPFGEAASSYMTYMQPYAGSFKLGAPAVTNGAASSGMGLGYLSSFIGSCKSLGCTIDFVPIHWYNDASEVDDFKTHVTQAYTAGGNRPVWVTEIGASGSVAEQQAFLDEVIPWLNAQDFVERFAYFMVQDGSLMSGSSVSALGKTYAFASS